jgi:hypothetical protein
MLEIIQMCPKSNPNLKSIRYESDLPKFIKIKKRPSSSFKAKEKALSYSGVYKNA